MKDNLERLAVIFLLVMTVVLYVRASKESEKIRILYQRGSNKNKCLSVTEPFM